MPGVKAVEATSSAEGRLYRLRGSRGVDLRAGVYELARQRNWPLRELHREARTLEAVFSELATTADQAHSSRGDHEQ